MANVIIEDKPYRLGKHRSEQEKNLRDDWGCETMSEEQLDKCSYLERKTECSRSFFDKSEIDQIGKPRAVSTERIVTRAATRKYRAGYDRINWAIRAFNT